MYSFQFLNVIVYIFIIAVCSLKDWIISIHWLLNDPFGSYKTTASDALINITENKRKALDDCSCGVFVDLQKAFDTVCHQILLAKMNHCGICGVSNDWLKNHIFLIVVSVYP